MGSLFAIIVAAALCQSAFARPSLPPPVFSVPALNTFKPSAHGVAAHEYIVGFNVTDSTGPHPVSTTCETRWDVSEATTGWPHDYLSNCTNPEFAFKFPEYSSYYNFTLDVKHTTGKLKKMSTVYAKAPLTLDLIECTHAASGFSACGLKPDTVFSLLVYETEP